MKRNYDEAFNTYSDCKQDWDRILTGVRSFSNYGLVSFTKHAQDSLKQRSYGYDEIIDVINKKDTEIVQYHRAGTYHHNHDDNVVLLGKVIRNGKREPVHIVLSLKGYGEVPQFSVVTVYKPDKEHFYASGRIVR